MKITNNENLVAVREREHTLLNKKNRIYNICKK